MLYISSTRLVCVSLCYGNHLDLHVLSHSSPTRRSSDLFPGVPCVVDLVAMRDAIIALCSDPQRINPLLPSELVIDHSVIADVFGRPNAAAANSELEFQRNVERYQLLRWAQQAFDNFKVVPPDTGICHQVNLK